MSIWKEKCELFEENKTTWQYYVHMLFLEDDETFKFEDPKIFWFWKKNFENFDKNHWHVILVKTYKIYYKEIHAAQKVDASIQFMWTCEESMN